MFKKTFFILLICLFSQLQVYSINSNDAYDFYSHYIDDNNLQAILSYLYEKQPGFFLDDPSFYFPLNRDNIEDFFFVIEPLVNFFKPLLWGNLVFPFTVEPVSYNLDTVFLPSSNMSDIDKVILSDVIILKGGNYAAMKKQLLYINEILNQYNKNVRLFILTDSSRSNTNLYYESFDNIIVDIQSAINRVLTPDDLLFIASNLDNEYTLGLIVNRFFGSDNTEVLDSPMDPLLLNFNDYLVENNYSNASILFLSNNIFALYNELNYSINALDNYSIIDSNFPVTFAGQDIGLIDPVNPEGVLLRKLKMITVLLNLIVENIED